MSSLSSSIMKNENEENNEKKNKNEKKKNVIFMNRLKIKKGLLEWCKKVCKKWGYRIIDFSISFFDGLGYCSMIKEYFPNMISDFDQLETKEEIYKELNNAMEKIELKGLIKDYFDTEINEDIIMVYVSRIRSRLIEKSKLIGVKVKEEEEKMKKEKVILIQSKEEVNEKKKNEEIKLVLSNTVKVKDLILENQKGNIIENKISPVENKVPINNHQQKLNEQVKTVKQIKESIPLQVVTQNEDEIKDKNDLGKLVLEKRIDHEILSKNEEAEERRDEKPIIINKSEGTYPNLVLERSDCNILKIEKVDNIQTNLQSPILNEEKSPNLLLENSKDDVVKGESNVSVKNISESVVVSKNEKNEKDRVIENLELDKYFKSNEEEDEIEIDYIQIKSKEEDILKLSPSNSPSGLKGSSDVDLFGFFSNEVKEKDDDQNVKSNNKESPIPENVDKKSLNFLLECGIERDIGIKYLQKYDNNMQMAMNEIFKKKSMKTNNDIKSKREIKREYEGADNDIKQMLKSRPSSEVFPPKSVNINSVLVKPEIRMTNSQERFGFVKQDRREIINQRIFYQPQIDDMINQQKHELTVNDSYQNVPLQNMYHPLQTQENTPTQSNNNIVPTSVDKQENIKSNQPNNKINMSLNEKLIKFLTDAGISRDKAKEALRITNNDVSKAMDILFKTGGNLKKMEPLATPGNPSMTRTVYNAPNPNQTTFFRPPMSMRQTYHPSIIGSGIQQQQLFQPPPNMMRQTMYQPSVIGSGSQQVFQPPVTNAYYQDGSKMLPNNPQNYILSSKQYSNVEKSQQSVPVLVKNNEFKYDCAYSIQSASPSGGFISIGLNYYADKIPLILSGNQQKWVFRKDGFIESSNNNNLNQQFVIGVKHINHGEYLRIEKKKNHPHDKNQKWIFERNERNGNVIIKPLFNQVFCIDFDDRKIVLKYFYNHKNSKQRWLIIT